MKAIIWCAVSTRKQAEEEMMSLPVQEQDARRLCAERGWTVTDVLIVPGHSRSMILEYDKLVAAAAKKGIPAFAQLRRHWELKDFDVLIVRDGDRLARAQGLLGTIVESVVQSGAIIWSMNDGEINLANYRFWIAMTGLKASAHVDQLVAMRDKGLQRRIEAGRPLTATVPLSHRLVRDEKGRPVRLEVNEEAQPLVRAAVDLVLAGTSWADLEWRLNQQGWTTTNGKPHRSRKFYRLFHLPAFWGHTARKAYQGRKEQALHFVSGWAFDPLVEPPSGVIVLRNTHPPAVAGRFAEQLRAELHRRQGLRGRASPNRRPFTGLVMCGECGGAAVYNTKRLNDGRHSVSLVCNQAKRRHQNLCGNVGQILERRVFEFTDDLLRQILDGLDLSAMADLPPDVATVDYSAAAENLQSRARSLIAKQAQMPGELASLYDDELTRIGNELRIVRGLAFEQEQEQEQKTVGFARTREEIARLGLERFWELEPGEVNRHLRMLLGPYRLILLQKKIVGVARRSG